MKLIRFFVVLIILVAFATPAMAGSLWGLVKNSDMPVIQSKGYQLEVKGVNVRVYAFHVPEMKSVCTQVWDDNNSTMECKTYKEMGITDEEAKRLYR